MEKQRAVFLDRDGVVNELVYHREQEVIDSPFTIGQFKLMPTTGPGIKALQQHGFLVILVSNQPGIAKRQMTMTVFDAIAQKMRDLLRHRGVALDGEYYCLHHPEAKLKQYRVNCNCRKPQPGLLLAAARVHNIDLSKSWMIGDNLSDIQAGQAAGCRTILLSKLKGEVLELMAERNIKPEFFAINLLAAARIILPDTR